MPDQPKAGSGPVERRLDFDASESGANTAANAEMENEEPSPDATPSAGVRTRGRTRNPKPRFNKKSNSKAAKQLQAAAGIYFLTIFSCFVLFVY